MSAPPFEVLSASPDEDDVRGPSPIARGMSTSSSIASSLGVTPVPSPAHDRKGHDAYARSQQRAQHSRQFSSSSSSGGIPIGSGSTGSNAYTSSGAGLSASPVPSSSFSFGYRETLDARAENLADGSRTINQYRLTQQIGRGAYGTVYRAELLADPGVTFAVKEFGKTRLRKTYRAANMRKMAMMRGRGRGRPIGTGQGPNRAESALAALAASGPAPSESASSGGSGPSPGASARGSPVRGMTLETDPLFLIRHEIAILKKLNHPNVVKLFEVLDDPSQDSLYMVFENCPDGPIIDVQLHEQAEPLSEDVAREYFAQILLGVEYLHSNEIIHRDIKPDNILLTSDRQICKIVDFGVSEIFMKPDEEKLAKSAGTPAFMSPELCTAGSGDSHAMADDIWAIGATLYCMVVGRLPFEKAQIYELYESIKNDEPEYPDSLSPELLDLLQGLLRKDASKRLGVAEARVHPWVTLNGTYPLVSVEENLETVVHEITEEELERAICKITSVFTIARAVHRFKRAGSSGKSRTLSSGGSASSSGPSSAQGSFSLGSGEGTTNSTTSSGASGSGGPGGALAALVTKGLADMSLSGEHANAANSGAGPGGGGGGASSKVVTVLSPTMETPTEDAEGC